MEKASELLIIILSSVLVIFFIVLIVAVAKFIDFIKSLKRITEKAERLADSAEAVGNFFEHATGPVALGKFLYNITHSVVNGRKKGKRGEEDE